MARTHHGLDAAPQQLSPYLAVASRVAKLLESGLVGLTADVMQGVLQAGEVKCQLEIALCESVITRAWQERPELSEFHGGTYEKLRERFALLDQQRIALSRLEVPRNTMRTYR
jgi:hypothetical protein